MKKALLMLTALSSLSSLSARELWCEQCEAPPEPCCQERLFVERSQVFGHLNYLYWTVGEGVQDYAVKTEGTSTLPDTFTIGKYKRADLKWRSGFRIAGTYYRCFKYWDVTGEYTWFYTKGAHHVNAPLNPTRQTLTAPPFLSARTWIDLHYNVGDVYVARVFDPNEHLRMRVYTGLTLAALNQSWRTIYSNAIGDFDKVKEKWRYWGGGIRIGSTVDWWWISHLYATGKFSSAVLIGTYKNETQQTFDNTTVLSRAKYHDHKRFAYHVQFMLGPSWQQPFDCWSYEIFAGYEFNLWFNLHERIRSEFSPPNATKATFYSDGLLGLQGLTLRATVGF
jgi:hypothetical protein